MDTFEPAPDCWYLTGATAAGKTAASLELAERLGAEIISLDSMAVYLEMEIGTAKPEPAARERVPHHLVDLVAPDEEFSISQYLEAAHAAIADIKSRGREVLFVGGTALYLKALLRGLWEGPDADPALRAALEAEAAELGSPALHERMTQIDPESGQRIHPNDTRRIVRALEVFEKTGQTISSFQSHFNRGRDAEQCRVFVLDWPRDVLHDRINKRVDAMFAAGLVEEVQGLLDRYERLSTTAAQAVGYRDVLEHLAGERDLAETIEVTKAHTRQFARRQLIWVRGLSECRWISVADRPERAEVAAEILTAGQ